ncbi:hypothetical protein DACRYDRAFT_23256 [Dacryopinax primogenitus]|uniref:Uncharacterized protein n=1 Tax=Dacryopinax primogenitus (strain DJM 731) TaxID=1858805 RepID=M5FSE7_DACPD|nr:uncharacterized protein DACRYDRAFT_23256 [Dacryopinax primogenitus]EJU00341.1 hypothetical protein DACRYDRAFT_23256 [Dacryopinax primogenitus]
MARQPHPQPDSPQSTVCVAGSTRPLPVTVMMLYPAHQFLQSAMDPDAISLHPRWNDTLRRMKLLLFVQMVNQVTSELHYRTIMSSVNQPGQDATSHSLRRMSTSEIRKLAAALVHEMERRFPILTSAYQRTDRPSSPDSTPQSYQSQ